MPHTTPKAILQYAFQPHSKGTPRQYGIPHSMKQVITTEKTTALFFNSLNLSFI